MHQCMQTGRCRALNVTVWRTERSSQAAELGVAVAEERWREEGGGGSKDGGGGEQRSYSVLQVRRGGDVLSLRLLLQIHHQDELETKCKFTSDSENLKQRNNKYVFLITE